MLIIRTCQINNICWCRLAPHWSDGFVTLARAQREMGEVELSLQNMQQAKQLYLLTHCSEEKTEIPISPDLSTSDGIMHDHSIADRSGVNTESVANKDNDEARHADCGKVMMPLQDTALATVIVTTSDSDLNEIEEEIKELQDIVVELEKRREVYLEEIATKKGNEVSFGQQEQIGSEYEVSSGEVTSLAFQDAQSRGLDMALQNAIHRWEQQEAMRQHQLNGSEDRPITYIPPQDRVSGEVSGGGESKGGRSSSSRQHISLSKSGGGVINESVSSSSSFLVRGESGEDNSSGNSGSGSGVVINSISAKEREEEEECRRCLMHLTTRVRVAPSMDTVQRRTQQQEKKHSIH